MKTGPSQDIENENTSQKDVTASQIFLKATGLSLIFVFIFLLLTALAVVAYGYSKFSAFLKATDLSQEQVISYVQEGWDTKIKSDNQKTNILLLGIDTVANKDQAPPLTDSMLILSLDHNTGQINTLSLPRDLWSTEYQTKINALYVYGQDRYPEEPERFTQEVIQEMTDLPIHYTLVISLDMVADLVNSVGGVEVTVPVSFVDEEFPRSDVDIETATSEAELYETVIFNKGAEVMDGERVLKYIRSRHSEGDTGTDTDRTARQQLVFSSLAQKLSNKETILKVDTLASIYKWYQQYIQQTFSEQESVAFIKLLYPHRKNLKIVSHNLTVYPDDPEGLIEHPPIQSTNNQWVFTIRNPENFRQSVYDMLSDS